MRLSTFSALRRDLEQIYCWISKVMSSLYFELDLFCLYEARTRECDIMYTAVAVSELQREILCVQFFRLLPVWAEKNHRTQSTALTSDITVLI